MKPLRLLGLTTLYLLSAWSASGAESRLFYTPAERARVTADREAMLARETRAGASLQAPVAPAVSEEPSAPPGAPEGTRGAITGPPRLDGISLAHDGRAYAWIGGRRYQDGDLFDGQRLRVMYNGVQLLDAGAPGPLRRVGEAIRGAVRE